MSKCSIDLYQDVKHCVGEVNMPGVRNHIFGIRRENIVLWPEFPKVSEETSNLETIVTYQGDFVLAEDSVWVKIDLVPDVSSFSAESQGSWGSKTFVNTINAIMPGVGKKVSGFCAMVNNDDMVFLVPMRNGEYRVFGNDAFAVEVNPKQESGAAATDSAQTTLEIKVTDSMPAPFYNGVIHTMDGDIDAKDGSIVKEPTE